MVYLSHPTIHLSVRTIPTTVQTVYPTFETDPITCDIIRAAQINTLTQAPQFLSVGPGYIKSIFKEWCLVALPSQALLKHNCAYYIVLGSHLEVGWGGVAMVTTDQRVAGIPLWHPPITSIGNRRLHHDFNYTVLNF